MKPLPEMTDNELLAEAALAMSDPAAFHRALADFREMVVRCQAHGSVHPALLEASRSICQAFDKLGGLHATIRSQLRQAQDNIAMATERAPVHCGKRTCVSSFGTACPHLRHNGLTSFCALFNGAPLVEEDALAIRCNECVKVSEKLKLGGSQ